MMKASPKAPWDNSRSVPALAAAAFGLLVLGTSGASWAVLQAQLDRNTVQDGDILTLTIESDGTQTRERPDVTPLRKDFEVLGTSNSSETRIFNGSRTDRTRWLVRLQTRHAGIIDIPPITLGGEHTVALKLNVTEASPEAAKQASKHVFLEVESAATGRPIYVQQQIPYIVRLYYDNTVQKGEITAPDPTNAIVEQLGEEKRYTAKHDGHQYNVIERRYAISPEKSGELRIPPASFRGSFTASEKVNGDADPINDLMNRFLRNTPLSRDPLFSGGLGSAMSLGDAGQPVVAGSKEIMLNVQPRPAEIQGNWLPAEQITLHDSWGDNAPKLKVGEPATRTITIEAKGLAASQIPPLSQVRPDNASLYPESPDNQSRTDGNAIFGISKQSMTYIPTSQGKLNVPPVELAWWDTRANVQSRAVLPAREYVVEAGVAGTRADASPPAPVSGAQQATSALPPSSADHPLPIASLAERLQYHWVLSGVGAALMMILSFIGFRHWRLLGLRFGGVAAHADPVPRRNAAMRALRQACSANDRQAAKDALLNLARAVWPEKPPRGLSVLASRLESGGKEVIALDQSLYGAVEWRWEGDALWRVIRHGLQPKRSETLHEEDGFGALYH